MPKKYKVVKGFTDQTGKAWKEGDDYTEKDAARIKTAEAAGNVEEEGEDEA
jgi:hypothetical protein